MEADWNEKGKELFQILRLRTPPVGVHFSEKDEVPEGAFRPSKYGMKMAVCQAIGFARFTGRTVAMKFEDFGCPPSMVVYGLVRGDLKEELRNILVKAGWFESESAEELAEMPENFLPQGKYKTFIFGDLTKMNVEPQAILIFGNSAQIGRLIQAKTYYGGVVKAELIAKTASCSEALFPALNGEPSVSIPGAGDRAYGGLDEDEAIFSMPYSWVDKIIDGLKKAGKGANVGYPVSPFLFFTPRFPKMYKEFMEKLEKI
ncbi:MAG: DUF169 domain-containing protein [Archaeoglobus sp.]|nr:DUF169 domain-containing protein [Archaeoglobus sp.]